MKKLFLALGFALVTGGLLPAAAQTIPPPQKSPCADNPQNHEFDYWVGEWDVFATGTNSLVGHSLVQSISGGCAILENWTAANNQGDGKSINFIDPTTKMWKQTRVGSGGMAAEFTHGEYRDGAMRFTVEKTNAQGQKMQIHFTFFNQGPSQMRQLYETSVDDGKTWKSVYDFTYKRKA